MQKATGSFWFVFFAINLCLGFTFGTVRAFAQTGNEEPICRDDPNVFFCDNFEDRNVGGADYGRRYKNNGYAMSTFPSNNLVQTAEHVDGIKAVAMLTPANRVSGGVLDTAFPGQRTVYWRWYVKYSTNYFWSNAVKHNELLVSQKTLSGIFNFVSNQGKTVPIFTWLGNSSQVWYPPNRNGGFSGFTPGRWYCVESRTTMNTLMNSADGYIQGWIDGVQYYEYPNVVVTRGAGDNPKADGFFLASYWNCDGQENCNYPSLLHPDMYRYMDNMIGSKQRVGCLNSPVPAPSPTPAPAPEPAPAPVASSISVASISLINADLDQPVPGYNPITNGMNLNLANLPVRLNIRANTSPAIVGSVRFSLDGGTVTENSSPYALFGDASGDFNSGSLNLGSHTLTVTPYTGSGLSGSAGMALTIQFSVSNQAPAPSPTPTGDLTPPTVTITSPVAGAVIKVNSVVALKSEATDTSGVARVEFYVSGTKICTELLAPYECNYTVPAAAGRAMVSVP
jgi:hypothetical protein